MQRLAFVLGALTLASCTQGGEPEPTPDVPDAVVAPDLIALSVKEARVLLSDVALELGEVSVVTGTYTDAAIIEQDPSAGTDVDPGMAVNVISGPAAAATVVAAAKGEEPPAVIHVRQPKSLIPDWEHDAVVTAFYARRSPPDGGRGARPRSTHVPRDPTGRFPGT